MRGDGSAANQVDIITGCRAVWEEAAERRWQPLMATLATAAWPRHTTSHTHTLRRDTTEDIGTSFQSCFWTYSDSQKSVSLWWSPGQLHFDEKLV